VIVKLNMREFLEADGKLCPVCGSDDLDSSDFEFWHDFLLSPRNCLGCGASWTASYRLMYYENLQK
jgi:hypothetical protein